jgi:transcription elongation factor Elf1
MKENVECPHCRTKQSVRVQVQIGARQLGSQHLSCCNCNQDFFVHHLPPVTCNPFPSE